MWQIVFTKSAQKDFKKLSQSNVDANARKLLDVLAQNPYQTPPPFEKLIGDLSGYYSRRLNVKHRLIYQVLDDEKTIKIISMWAHYE